MINVQLSCLRSCLSLSAFYIVFVPTRVRKKFLTPHLEKLLNIALEDISVIDFIKQLETMPDIAQAEIDRQIETINRMTDGKQHYG